MKYSTYQLEIFREIQETKNNIVIGAVAGSGKTTTIVEALKLIPRNKQTIFLAFNKSIVEELKLRVPMNVTVSTLHSFGFRQAIKNLGTIKVSEGKVWKWIDICGKHWKIEEDIFDYGYRIGKMVDLMRMTLSTKYEDIESMCDKYGIFLSGTEIPHALDVLERMSKDVSAFDFADMIYQPAIKAMRLQKFDYVFIDECQDLNRAQQTLVKKIVKPIGGRIIAVGDPAQAIYGFAGADIESYNNMLSMFQNTIELPLSVCYRCAKSIVVEAQRINELIQPHEDQIEGEVNWEGKWQDVREGDWVLCRNTKPLVELFIRYLKLGIKAKIKGRDIGENLINLLKRTKAKSLEQAILKLNKDLILITIKLKQRKVRKPQKHPKYVNLLEKIEIIKILGEGMSTVTDVIRRIETIFSDEKEQVTLSTIHKSKGLEANRIFVICRDLLPSSFATEPHELLQEKNLEYVMVTRAKKSLIYVDNFPNEKETIDLTRYRFTEEMVQG